MILNPIECGWCGAVDRPFYLHGKPICGRCSKPYADCCDGEQAQPNSQESTDPEIQTTGGEVKEGV